MYRVMRVRILNCLIIDNLLYTIAKLSFISVEFPAASRLVVAKPTLSLLRSYPAPPPQLTRVSHPGD